jgi:hypothetical protein
MTDDHTFVCYAREDGDFVARVTADLRARGIRLFVDTDIAPGADWDRRIDESLRTCSNRRIVLSPAAVASAEVRGELRAALNLAKPIVPVLYRACDIPRQLQNVQYLDFGAGKDTVTAFDTLSAALQSNRRSPQDRSGPNGLASRDLRNRRALLDDVKSEAAGRLAQSLHAGMLNLLKEKQPEQVTRRWDSEVRIPHMPPTPLGSDVRIVEVFDDEAVRGKLLILGAPGSGKTTSLLELSQELTRRAEADASEPMPVLVNLSSWRTDGQSLAGWLVDALKVKYGVRKDYGLAWLGDGALVPLLDGLDEVAPEHQESCVQAINHFQADYRLRHIVVCCRLAEYENYKTKLRLNGAIRLLPLVNDQIRDYLAHAESAALWHSISGDHETMALARSPLLLHLIAVAYEETSADDWQRLTSASERQMHLFDVYVRRVLSDDRTQRPYSKTQTVHWLAWLARTMKDHAQPELLIEHMQPTWLDSVAQRIIYRFCVCAFVSVAFVVAVQFGAGLFAGVPKGAIGTAFSGMVANMPAGALWQQYDSLIVVLMGLAAGLTVAAQRRIQPIETVLWSWANGWRGMAAGGRRLSISGMNYAAYVGVGAGLLEGVFMLKSTFDAGQLDPALRRFNVAGYVLASVVLLALAVAILRTVRPGVWLVGGVNTPPRGSTADALVSGLAFAAAASPNMGLAMGAGAGLSMWCVGRFCGGSKVLSPRRFADALVAGLAGGLGIGVILWRTLAVRSEFVRYVGVWSLGGMGVAATAALAAGLFGGFRHPHPVPPRPIGERLRMVTRSLVLGVLIAAISGLVVVVARRTGGMPLVRGIGLVNARVGAGWTIGLLCAVWIASTGALLGLSTGAYVGALIGILRGLTGPDIQRRTAPNQGMRQSAKNMGVFAIVGGLIVGLPYGLTNLMAMAGMTRVAPNAQDWVNLAVAPAVLFAVMGALVPGAACVQHYALRFVFWCFGLAPLRYVRFLNYATESTLLQRVGGRYRFLHELLREHFAAIESSSGLANKVQS